MGQRGLFCAVGNRVDEPSREARGKPGGSHQSLPLVISPVQRNSRSRAVDRAAAPPPLPGRFPYSVVRDVVDYVDSLFLVAKRVRSDQHSNCARAFAPRFPLRKPLP